MNVKIKKSVACGKVLAPASKSVAHRLLICAGLSQGTSTVRGISKCKDVLATIDCLEALGAKIEINSNIATVHGVDIKNAKPQKPLFCRESGSTIRFMLPIAMLSENKAALCGAESLMKRPMTVYEQIFLGSLEKSENAITVKGPLKAGEYTLPGDVSSQFVSGLIFALPLADGDSIIKIVPPIESRSYIDLTINAVREFGIKIEWLDENTLSVLGNQCYKAGDVTVEGDYSGAAFTDAFNVIGGNVEVLGLNNQSVQADRVYKEYFELLKKEKASLHIENCPDLAPILFSLAAALNGGIFYGTRRLKIKESDRAEVMAKELSKFGATVNVFEDSVEVIASDFHAPSEVLCGNNDHRVVMSLAVLLSLTGGEIEGAEAIDKSYPEFFEDIAALGIEAEKYEIR